MATATTFGKNTIQWLQLILLLVLSPSGFIRMTKAVSKNSVTIKNFCPVEDLTITCSSKDTKIADNYVLEHEKEMYWDFDHQVFGRTLYACKVSYGAMNICWTAYSESNDDTSRCTVSMGTTDLYTCVYILDEFQLSFDKGSGQQKFLEWSRTPC
ncbi:hypothetical protein Mapa_017074 [Marchantia paleacea]|nr:hypothetical protein Mapa_017074 [Marchantia paleacea]